MHHGLIGCLFNLDINHQSINLSHYINSTSQYQALKSGPCSMDIGRKRSCLCEHHGECRWHHAHRWSCDCSRTAYTGDRCEQLAYHIALNRISTIEYNTGLLWSEQIDHITFRLRVSSTMSFLVLMVDCFLFAIDETRLFMTTKSSFKYVHVVYRRCAMQFNFRFVTVF
jgi:hypothetical protein